MPCRQFYFNNNIKAFILKQPQPASFLRGVDVVRFLSLSTGECFLFREVGADNPFAVGGYTENIPLQCRLCVAGRADCH